MKLYLKGHDYKYAAEQIMMALFPDVKPEYSQEAPAESEDYAAITVSSGERFITASAIVKKDGTEVRGIARAGTECLTDKLQRDRQMQRIVKLSFYRAALQLLPEAPAWGALTGIRPGTLMTRFLEQGLSDGAALRQMKRSYFLRDDKARLCLATAKHAMEVESWLRPEDIALYVGIPFCPTRCAYCSFVSQSVEKSMGLIEPFLSALWFEIEAVAKIVRKLGLRVRAVYVGGGTPTTLSSGQLTELLDRLEGEFDLSRSLEFSVEAGRPDTITEEKLRALEGRATRISINPQSMNDRVLEAIGRRHTAEDIRTAYQMARGEFSGQINMDLIAGLPADTAEGFNGTIEELISMEPDNITIHTLALKRGSKITIENTQRPDKSQVEDMLRYADSALTTAGYGPYYLYRQKFMSGGFENVGWAKPGSESLYNILIMEELCTILAMGGGASTKLVDRKSGLIKRIFDPKYPKEYIERIEGTVCAKNGIEEFYSRKL